MDINGPASEIQKSEIRRYFVKLANILKGEALALNDLEELTRAQATDVFNNVWNKYYELGGK